VKETFKKGCVEQQKDSAGKGLGSQTGIRISQEQPQVSGTLLGTASTSLVSALECR
jgi:hypothetical protein